MTAFAGPQRFRKKPVEIEAMQIHSSTDKIFGEMTANDASVASVSGWLLGNGFKAFKVHGERPFGIAIETLEGVMVATAGDWIIRGVQGEFYPCKPDIFAATYEPVTS
jgi:hypothetical protein